MRGESARPGKRPLRALSASEKMDAIQRVHEGESKASVARDIGVPESTLRGWCKSEHKIRGMARNSSTPDSEAHSPASSSGANVTAGNLAGGSANLSSEDEGPCVKKSKIDQQTSVTSAGTSYVAGDICTDADGKPDNKPKIDYVGLMTSMAGMRPENSSLLLQQLGLLSGATGTLAKNLLSMTPALSHGSTVGLVENGLQYTKNSAINPCLTNTANSLNGGSNKRHSISAIAPAQMDSVVAKSCTRKSLPPAAEAPSTPVPASPRKTNENNSIREQRSSGKPKKDGNVSGNKKVDEALWLWLTQQQQLLGQQSASFNPSINQQDGSWFWQWYKQCSFPLITPTPLAPSPVAKKSSPSKARAMLDNVLCNNNNENVKRSLNMDEESAAEDVESSGDVPASTEEAIEHGEKFFKWLDKCSEPAVTRLQIIQFKYLLDNLKACRKKSSSSSKQSRK
ncbi:protein distal antenna-like [Osmia bicornis bicornis]|uniref:protein distal antenna-like n=1 Tax=Osmia bicornis bicornis TaxID=1437191 RepID=UPI0010F7E676|nr:protein distal antenna-like [Osmia bicornis bicornis]